MEKASKHFRLLANSNSKLWVARIKALNLDTYCFVLKSNSEMRKTKC